VAAEAEMMIDIFPVFALRHNGCRAGNLLMHRALLLIYYFRRRRSDAPRREIGKLLKIAASLVDAALR